jgi:hypothetical protein
MHTQLNKERNRSGEIVDNNAYIIHSTDCHT